jgi:hypothetical protein
MRFEAFIHNDDVTSFHVAIQGTQKVVVMGFHNFKNEELIKRRRVGQKMDAMGEKFKDEKNGVIIETCFVYCQKLYLFSKF